MPLAEIVESAVVASRPREELIQKFAMMRWVTHKMVARSSGLLNRNFRDAEGLSFHMFADNEATDFPATGFSQLGLQRFQNWLR